MIYELFDKLIAGEYPFLFKKLAVAYKRTKRNSIHLMGIMD